MLRSYAPLPVQRLRNPILLPLAPLRLLTRQCLQDIYHSRHIPAAVLKEQTESLMNALLDQWFVDPEGRLLTTFIEHSWEYPIVMESVVLELQTAFHRLIRDTVGTLVPSLRYRFEIEEGGDTLRIIPTLPTLNDYAERLDALADPDSGWVPSRYR